MTTTTVVPLVSADILPSVWGNGPTGRYCAVVALCDIIHGNEPLTSHQVVQLAGVRTVLANDTGVEIYNVLTPLDNIHALRTHASRAAASWQPHILELALASQPQRIVCFGLGGYFRSDHFTRFDGRVDGLEAHLWVSERGQELMIVPSVTPA